MHVEKSDVDIGTQTDESDAKIVDTGTQTDELDARIVDTGTQTDEFSWKQAVRWKYEIQHI